MEILLSRLQKGHTLVVPKQDLLDRKKGQRVWQHEASGRSKTLGEYAFYKLSRHF